MRLLLLPIAVLLTLPGCTTETPTTRPAGPRVEIRREVRDIETLRFEPGRNTDATPDREPQFRARVMDAYVYDDGPDEVRADVVAKAIPQIVVALDAYGEKEPAALVRIYFVTSGDPDDAWITSIKPPQLRAMSRLPEPHRTEAVKRLAWGYMSRRPVP